MALEKTTKQIILIVSALILATTTTVCIAKRDAIANFFRPKIKQENLINSPAEASVNSSEERTSSNKNNETQSEECDKILESLEKDEPQKEESVTLKEEYKKVRKERDKTQELLQEAMNVKEKAYKDYSAAFKKGGDLLYVPKKSTEERKAYEEKEEELVRILCDQKTTFDEAMWFCLSLEESLNAKKIRLGEIAKTLDEISPGWNDDLEQG